MIDKFLAVLNGALDFLERWLPAPAPRWEGPVRLHSAEQARAIGYCDDTSCPWYHKQNFLLSQKPIYVCQTCGRVGVYVPEERFLEGNEDVVRKVEVHYNFDLVQRKYRGIAVVEDKGLRRGGTYALYSPLIRTDKRALAVAEVTLGGLQRYLAVGPDSAPITETILCLDDPREKFAEDCETLHQSLKHSALAKGNGKHKRSRD